MAKELPPVDLDEALASALGPAESEDESPLTDAELDDEFVDAAWSAIRGGDKDAFRDALLGLLGR